MTTDRTVVLNVLDLSDVVLFFGMEEIVLKALLLLRNRVTGIVVLLVILWLIFRLVGGSLTKWGLAVELLMVEDLGVLGVTVWVDSRVVDQLANGSDIVLVMLDSWDVVQIALSLGQLAIGIVDVRVALVRSHVLMKVMLQRLEVHADVLTFAARKRVTLVVIIAPVIVFFLMVTEPLLEDLVQEVIIQLLFFLIRVLFILVVIAMAIVVEPVVSRVCVVHLGVVVAFIVVGLTFLKPVLKPVICGVVVVHLSIMMTVMIGRLAFFETVVFLVLAEPVIEVSVGMSLVSLVPVLTVVVVGLVINFILRWIFGRNHLDLHGLLASARVGDEELLVRNLVRRRTRRHHWGLLGWATRWRTT